MGGFLSGRTSLTTVQTADIADDAITEAKVATDAIGITELKAGTDGNIISYDASGDPVAIATGDDGQVLTSAGAGAQPAFEDAGGGSWNLIGTSDASDDATVTVTGINSTYDTYGVAVSQMVPASDDVDFYIRFGDSSGIDSGASDYAYHASGGRAGASTARTAYDGSAAFIGMKLTGDGVNSGSGDGFGMMAFLHNPSDSGVLTSISGTYWYLTSVEGDGGSFGANHRTVIAHDRIQVLFSSGNVTSGRLTVWGIAHA